MKFEGLVFKPTGNEPKEMAPFLQHYSFVNRFFQAFNREKLTTTDNIANFSAPVVLQHGIQSIITHNLNYVPRIVQHNGRVELIEVTASDVKKITIRPRLHTVSILNPSYNRPQLQIQVSDISFFVQGIL